MNRRKEFAKSRIAHPKECLYRYVYDPLVREWFDLAFHDIRLRELVQSARHGELVRTMRLVADRLSELAQQLVAGCGPSIIEVAHRYRADVVWIGSAVPPPEAGLSDVRASLGYKFQRNVGQALVEALLCLDSALAFLRETGRDEVNVFRVLARSTSLLASLSVLHDDREGSYIEMLAQGRSFVYPDTSTERVIRGEFRIDLRNLKLVGTGQTEQVRFALKPSRAVDLPSPTLACPAHRLYAPHGPRLNDTFWTLLVEIYARSTGHLPPEFAEWATFGEVDHAHERSAVPSVSPDITPSDR